MKTIFLAILSQLLIVSVFCSSADLFSYDKQKVENELSELSTLEQTVISYQGKSIEQSSDFSLNQIQSLRSSSNSCPIVLSNENIEPPLGVPSFMWGCCFSVAGMQVVYMLTEEDPVEVKKAFNGCLTSAAVIGTFYFIGVLISTSSLMYY